MIKNYELGTVPCPLDAKILRVSYFLKYLNLGSLIADFQFQNIVYLYQKSIDFYPY